MNSPATATASQLDTAAALIITAADHCGLLNDVATLATALVLQRDADGFEGLMHALARAFDCHICPLFNGVEALKAEQQQ